MPDIIEKIKDLFPKDLEISSRHSYFQLQYFLIGKEPTNQAKMWQCLRELQSRKETLESMELQIEEEKDSLDLQKLNLLELENEKGLNADDIKKRRIEINLRSIKRKIQFIEKTIFSLLDKKKNIEQECEFFIQTFKNINSKESLKHFDDLDSQKEYWGAKLSEKVNLKLITNGNIDTDLLETILALPDDIQIKKFVVNKVNNLTNEVKKIKNG